MILNSNKGESDQRKEDAKLYESLNNIISKGDIDAIVIASRTGNLSLKIAEKFKGIKLVSVTEFIYSEEIKKEMKKAAKTSYSGNYFFSRRRFN